MNSLPESAKTSDKDRLAAPRAPPSITTHYLRYSASNAIVLLAGFISFPILTRLLDNTEFGILRYYETFMLVGVALIKLGAPHAIIRFYPYDADPQRIRAFGTNMVLLPMLLSGLLCVLAVLGLALWHMWGGRELQPIFWCAVVAMPMLAANAIVQMVVRASERSDIVMATRIFGRLLELVLVLGAVILVQQSALAVYGGKLIATALLLAWLLHWLRRNVHVARDAIDFRAFRHGLIFGLPLMAHELAYSVLSNFDRVLLKEITGDFAAVGTYAIGYALAMQVNLFIDATLSEAFIPVANRAYETGGKAAVRALKERVLLPMTYAVVAIVAMILVTGNDLIVALSGPSKSASGEVFIVVGITMSIYALLCISNFGLLLKERTGMVLLITVGTAVLNVALNYILIPRMGYMGAAWAAAVSYAAMSVARFIACPTGLVRFPKTRILIVSLGCAAVLVSVAHRIDLFGLHDAWARLLAAGALFVLLYGLPVLVLDPALRRVLLTFGTRTK